MKHSIIILLSLVCIIIILVSCSMANSTKSNFTPSIIQVSVTASVNPNHSFTVTTNLPDGTSLILTLFSKDNSYRAQDKVYIFGGKATSAVFSNNGMNLSGEYTLEVIMPIATQQSKEVQKVIGRDCEYLAGDLVTTSSALGKKIVEASFNFVLTAPKTTDDIIRETDYNNLTKTQKLNIIYWIESRYEYYDKVAGGYSGDKYTKTIFNEASKKYNKTYQQIDTIWGQSYNLKYK